VVIGQAQKFLINNGAAIDEAFQPHHGRRYDVGMIKVKTFHYAHYKGVDTKQILLLTSIIVPETT
jgi:hypothetical protein